MLTIYRYEVPVDDQWHEFKLAHVAFHVAARQVDVVEFWTWHDDAHEDLAIPRRLRVFGTGQPMPDRCHWWGTALHGPLVWHLLEQQ